jgi:N-acetylmuramoyl-L-alanine amidase
MPVAMKFLVTALLFLTLAGCASGPRLDTSHPSVNFDHRIQFVVLHYTATNLQSSLALLTKGQVSSHYLIGDDARATIYKLVDEDKRSWHAGESEWMGRTWLNSSSIGIEIVNPGYRDTPTGRVWYPYSEAQVQSLVTLLKDISQRNRINPRFIIGHSDIAPGRKLDPGPLFPWKRLADEGLGIWPEAQAVARIRPSTPGSCRALPGSRKSWHAWGMPRRKPVNWMWRHGVYWPPSRCASGRRCSTVRRMRKVQRSCGH